MKKYLAIFICLQICAINLFSQNYKLPLWEKNIPNENAVKVEETIEITDKLRITAVDEPIIEVYLPSKNYATGEAFVICPGGGYGVVVYEMEGINTAKEFANNGVNAFLLKYRLPNDSIMIDKKVGPLQDALQAIKLVRENSEKWGIDKNKVGIMGFSAGGHLASTAATHFDMQIIENSNNINLRPDFQILIYPVISMQNELTHLIIPLAQRGMKS